MIDNVPATDATSERSFSGLWLHGFKHNLVHDFT